MSENFNCVDERMVGVMRKQSSGFTLIELIIVIVVLGILAVVAAPRFLDLSTSAKIASLQSVAGTMKSTISMVRMKAFAKGLKAVSVNPGAGQSRYVIDFGGVSAEVDHRNLCPESQAELGDALTMVDFIQLQESGGLTARLNNQYTLVGYDIPGFSVPTNRGCYIIYDSFGSPHCTVTVVTEDC